jgi:16S rRNA (cytosine967-C5)-methyltransferase
MVQERISPEAVINVAVEVAKKYRMSGFVNAVLRKALAGLRKEGLACDFRSILPDELIERWRKRFSDSEMQQLAEAFLSQPEFTFRMEHGSVPVSFAYTETAKVAPEFPFGKASAADVLESDEFKKGKLYIQDPAASLAVSIAPAHKFKSILDLCSAPGGKALMLLEKYPDVERFISFDRSFQRQKLTQKNFDLRGIKHLVSSDPAVLTGTFDLIMIDAPCSNTGVFRRRPDALWRFSGKSLDDTVKIQSELLEKAEKMLASNGYILYSTCSIEPEEDTLTVQKFISRHPEFTLQKEELLLPDSSHDGAYAAVICRTE